MNVFFLRSKLMFSYSEFFIEYQGHPLFQYCINNLVSSYLRNIFVLVDNVHYIRFQQMCLDILFVEVWHFKSARRPSPDMLPFFWQRRLEISVPRVTAVTVDRDHDRADSTGARPGTSAAPGSESLAFCPSRAVGGGNSRACVPGPGPGAPGQA